VCASIGIARFPQDGEAIDALLRNADTAMYRAKDLGRGRAMFYDVNMGGQRPAPTDSGLHLALRRREFSLFYQPQYSIADGSLTGLEALLRWQTQREGMRHPGDFVPAAEESGLIVDIGGWVLETACAQLAAWRDQGLSPPRLALNVSLQQLRHPDFVRNVRRVLDRFALPGDILELDIDERVLADPANSAMIERLAQTGACLALDGFGTGYSSLGYLREHPISAVKIDRSFLINVPRDSRAATLIETIIVMAHSLQKRVVAEGIETIEQLDFLRERQCDCAQGYYLARPLPAASVTELLSSRVYDNSSDETRAAG
jgi:EAL domain-containing protein (putative c-di-GMP-specific phosphodiesterase class I)